MPGTQADIEVHCTSVNLQFAKLEYAYIRNVCLESMIYALTKLKDALHAVAALFCAQIFQHKRLHAVLKRRADDVDQHKRLHAAGLAACPLASSTYISRNSLYKPIICQCITH